MRARTWFTLLTAAALTLTLLVSVASVGRFPYRNQSLHVSIETAAALISLLAAQLMYGRFRRSLDRRDLLLTAALALFAGSNLLFSAIPAITDAGGEALGTWAPVVGSALATAVLAAGALTAPCTVHRPAAAVRRVAWMCGLALLVIGTVTAVGDDWLPRALEPDLSSERATGPPITGHPAVLVLQLVGMGLFAAAAIGFARTAMRTQDRLIQWLAIAATLGGWARLNYFLFPSLYSDYLYTGDLLRVGFFVAVLVGCAREIRVAQRELEHAAVLDERRRLAREIHDGIAQELTYIALHCSVLAGRPGAPEALGAIEEAARRGLQESRDVIETLVRETDEPLAAAITRVAEVAAVRWGASVEAEVASNIEVPAATRQALVRIVGEAVTNAARHGKAQTVRLRLHTEPELHLSIVDDGVGFDPDSLGPAAGRHGITGMRERATALGGELRIGSRPGEGTQVVVVLP